MPRVLSKTSSNKPGKLFSAEEKIRIVIEGMRGEDTVASICRKYGINDSLYCKWSKDFLEAGKKRLNGDTDRSTNTAEVEQSEAGKTTT